jgi:hypothetical protein
MADGAAEDLSPWLCPFKGRSESEPEPEIMAVAFQEIVELSPQQIMATDPARRQTWEDAVKRTINESSSRRRTSEYVLLRSGQLVGAALMIFVKADCLRDIKNVEGGIKKVQNARPDCHGNVILLTYFRPAFLALPVIKGQLLSDWISATPACASSRHILQQASRTTMNATEITKRSAMA